MRFNAEAAFAEIAGHLRLGRPVLQAVAESRKRGLKNTAFSLRHAQANGTVLKPEKNSSFVLSPSKHEQYPRERNPMPKLEIIDPRLVVQFALHLLAGSAEGQPALHFRTHCDRR